MKRVIKVTIGTKVCGITVIAVTTVTIAESTVTTEPIAVTTVTIAVTIVVMYQYLSDA